MRIIDNPGGMDEHPGLFRIGANAGPGSGVKILNKPVPPAFKESLGHAEQNLYAQTLNLVGDKDPRHHEFAVQSLNLGSNKAFSRISMFGWEFMVIC